MSKTTKPKENITGFTKEQLLRSRQFSRQEKDIINAIMKDEKITIEEAKNIINNFLKRKVR